MITGFYLITIIPWSLATVVGDNGIDNYENTGKLLVVSMTTVMQQYNAMRIT
jgi:hypothetical protein